MQFNLSSNNYFELRIHFISSWKNFNENTFTSLRLLSIMLFSSVFLIWQQGFIANYCNLMSTLQLVLLVDVSLFGDGRIFLRNKNIEAFLSWCCYYSCTRTPFKDKLDWIFDSVQKFFFLVKLSRLDDKLYNLINEWRTNKIFLMNLRLILWWWP